MATQFFDQLSGPLSTLLPVDNWYTKTVKYGIKSDAKISRDDEVKFEVMRRGATFTNVLTTFGKFESVIVDDIYISDGINPKMMNEYARLDQALVSEQLRMHTSFKSSACNELSLAICDSQHENLVSLLINMLRWWVIKNSIKKNKKTDVLFDKNDIFYDDGHVSMSYEQYYQMGFDSDIKLYQGRSPMFVPFTESTIVGDGFFMPNLTDFSQRELAIIAKYSGDLKCEHPSRLAFSSPQLVDFIHVPSNLRLPTEMVMLIEDSDDELWSVMNKFIFSNRCQSQFDLAYTIVVMSMYAPLPRAVEANAWISPINKIMLPKLGSVRGLVPSIVSGQSFTSRPECEMTWRNISENRGRMFVHGVAACEALYGGIFEIVTAGGNMLTSLFETMGVTSAPIATPWRMMQECAAYRFGKGFETSWETNSGPSLISGLLNDYPTQREIEVSDIGDMSGYDFYRVEIDGRQQLRIKSRLVRPALFPVLSYGICDDRYYLNKKSYSAEMVYRHDLEALVSDNSKEVNKMMCIMRISGLDCVTTDMMNGKVHKNWAANSNGQVMPIFNPNDNMGAYVMPVRNIIMRKKNWMPMLPVQGRMKMSIDIEVKSYVVFTCGREVGRFNKMYRPMINPPKPMLEQRAATVVIKTGAQNSPYTYQDFVMRTMAGAAQDPTLSLAPSAITQLLPTEQEIITAGEQESVIREEDEV